MSIKQPAQKLSKVEEVQAYLRKLATELGPDARLPSGRVLCKTLSTTWVTLMSALDQLEAEQIIYRKERKGVFVSPRIHHASIHILLDTTYFEKETIEPFWSILWVRLMQESQKRALIKKEICHFHLVTPIYTPEATVPPEVEKNIRAGRVDGILAIGFNMKGHSWIREQGIPCVTFAGASYCIVEMDGNELVRLAVAMLRQQGCERIGFWIPNTPYEETDLAQEGQFFQKILKQQDLPFYPEFLRQMALPMARKPLTLQEQGYVLAKEVFSPFNTTKPDGLFIINDMMMDGALVAFKQLGVGVGSDVQLVTPASTGSPMLFGRTEQITVLEFDVMQLVRTMFMLLDRLLSGEQLPEVTRLAPRLRPPTKVLRGK